MNLLEKFTNSGKWYVKKRTGKVQTGAFYLPENLLKQLDLIADLECQSRSAIVEVALRFYEKGSENYAEFTATKRKFYKKRENRKKKAAILRAKKHAKFAKKAAQTQQKSLFDECDLQCFGAV